MTTGVVWRLLRQNMSVGQLAGYAVSNLVGLAIVLMALQFYCDVTEVWEREDSFMKRDFIVFSKKVGGLGSILGSKVDFSKEEIANLESQPWVKRVGVFTASDFNVSASVDMGGRGMSTALFLESVPDDFFDVKPGDWTYDPNRSEYVPIIISKDYLTLYNFGFASSRGLPQISEEMIGLLPIDLSLSGNGKQRWVKAHITGFSSRLNTIAVPTEFMAWANAEFGENNDANPSRLIVEVNSPGDPAISEYIKSHGYESAGDKVDNGKASYFLSVATSVVLAVGLVISLLSFVILLLSINLLLQRNKERLIELMQLGYSPSQVSRYYYATVGFINAFVLIGAIVALVIVASIWRGSLALLGVESVSMLPVICIGIAIMASITLINVYVISSTVRRNFFRS